VIKIIRL